tara:strand:+ start:1652 stop:2575 length:924 start_codon:yes stop_codon:yes gene_type:complete
MQEHDSDGTSGTATTRNQFLDAYLKLVSDHKIDPVAAEKAVVAARGVKRALLIGINYFGQNSRLNGCHADVDNMRAYLKDTGYTEFTILKDSSADPKFALNTCPTRDNIVNSIRKMVRKTRRGDTLYIHYSGHGSYVRDTSGDEADGRDECICPVDFNASPGGFILDDDLYKLCVVESNPGAKLRIVFDSCHSGSAIDLPCRWVSNNRTAVENAIPIDSNSDIIFISGCMDSQTSADAWINGAASGAMTAALLDSLYDVKKSGQHAGTWTWVDLVTMMRIYLRKNRYDQIPQLSSDSNTRAYAVMDF